MATTERVFGCKSFNSMAKDGQGMLVVLQRLSTTVVSVFLEHKGRVGTVSPAVLVVVTIPHLVVAADVLK